MARIWRTADGRHVADGHPDAAFLAYTDGDDVPKDVLAEVDGKPVPKRGRKPADKEAKPEADKSGSGSGLTINRRADKD
jgi:hypothetical protein